MTVAPGVRDMKVKGNTVRPRELHINTGLDTDFAAAGVSGTFAEDLATGARSQVKICCIAADKDDCDDSKEESAQAEERVGWMKHSRLSARREHAD